MRKLVYMMFLSNNRRWFRLRRKKNLVKHPKVSQYYETDCLENFILHLMFLLALNLLKTTIFRLEFSLSF